MKPDRNLQAFIAAAERQKLTHAADDLKIAQSTLTKRLSFFAGRTWSSTIHANASRRRA